MRGGRSTGSLQDPRPAPSRLSTESSTELEVPGRCGCRFKRYPRTKQCAGGPLTAMPQYQKLMSEDEATNGVTRGAMKGDLSQPTARKNRMAGRSRNDCMPSARGDGVAAGCPGLEARLFTKKDLGLGLESHLSRRASGPWLRRGTRPSVLGNPQHACSGTGCGGSFAKP